MQVKFLKLNNHISMSKANYMKKLQQEKLQHRALEATRESWEFRC
jgi:hypothetical protein